MPDALVVSRLLTSAAQRDRQLFEEWHTSLQPFLTRAVQSLFGAEVQRIDIKRQPRKEN